MKTYVLTPSSVTLPVVDVASGHVLARSCTPYFSKENLMLLYLALHVNTSREPVCVPFTSLRFINDVCLMVQMPETPYYPMETGSELLGLPLTLGNGITMSLGEVARADVAETGEVLKLTMKDGRSLTLPRRGGFPETPERGESEPSGDNADGDPAPAFFSAYAEYAAPAMESRPFRDTLPADPLPVTPVFSPVPPPAPSGARESGAEPARRLLNTSPVDLSDVFPEGAPSGEEAPENPDNSERRNAAQTLVKNVGAPLIAMVAFFACYFVLNALNFL